MIEIEFENTKFLYFKNKNTESIVRKDFYLKYNMELFADEVKEGNVTRVYFVNEIDYNLCRNKIHNYIELYQQALSKIQKLSILL